MLRETRVHENVAVVATNVVVGVVVVIVVAAAVVVSLLHICKFRNIYILFILSTIIRLYACGAWHSPAFCAYVKNLFSAKLISNYFWCLIACQKCCDQKIV